MTLLGALDELSKRSSRLLTSDCLSYRPDPSSTATKAEMCAGSCDRVSPQLAMGKVEHRPITAAWKAQRHIREFGGIISKFQVFDDFKAFFEDYSNALKVYKPNSGAQFSFNHAVFVVGYDLEQEFFYVKNSWGANWGEDGYFRVAFGCCGLLEEAYGLVFVPRQQPAAAQLQVTPSSGNPHCFLYQARPGDYLYSVAVDQAAALQALQFSETTLKLLPAADGPYSDYDLSVIEQIILLAEQICQQDYSAGRSGKELTLAKLLQAYEVVLPKHGVVPGEDVFYYRILLKLSLDPDVSWWSKFDKQLKANRRLWGVDKDKTGSNGQCRFHAIKGGHPACNSTAADAFGMGFSGRQPSLFGPRARSLSPPGVANGNAALLQLQDRKQVINSGMTARVNAESRWRGGPPSWRADHAAANLPKEDVDRYHHFSQLMARSNGWRQQLLQSIANRDAQAAAEQRWRLALSFWEVHLVWRCFRRWQFWAELVAEDTNSRHNQWLLLCSFKWWLGMVQHYRRQRPTAAKGLVPETDSSPINLQQQQQGQFGPTCLYNTVGASNRPASPLAGIKRLLQQQPHLRPHSSAAGMLRQEQDGKRLAACVLGFWRQAVAEQAQVAAVQSLLTWHHIQHVQAAVWNKWRQGFERQYPHHKLMSLVYKSRRRSTLQHVLKQWREWAPVKRSKRRRLRDVQASLSSSKLLRTWHLLRDYTRSRRGKRAVKLQASQHFRHTCLYKGLKQWEHILSIQDAFEQLADTAREALLQGRCFQAWWSRLLRQQHLMELQQLGMQLSARAAARTGLRAWRKRTATQQRHQALMLDIATRVLKRYLSGAWSIWLRYTLRRRQQQLELLEAASKLQQLMLQRVVQHWKAWVDQHLDWKAFQGWAMQQMTRHRLSNTFKLWQAAAKRAVTTRQLLGSFLQHSRQQLLCRLLSGWQSYLAARVVKRMKQLSALLQWEQSLCRKAWLVWAQRVAVWRFKRMRQLRAQSYQRLRLLDLALTSWSSLWVEVQELQQKAAFYMASKQAELQVLLLEAWIEEAAYLKLKRQKMERADRHSLMTRQRQVVTAWRGQASHQLRLRQLLTASLQRWAHLTLARAFEKWKDWALLEASLHRRARMVMALMAGRTQQWALCMLKEHALRKRRSRSAQHYHQRRTLHSMWCAWRQHVLAAHSFRQVLTMVSSSVRLVFMSEALNGWRDVVRAQQWKAVGMMRALLMWGGSRKQLCFKTWKHWVALKHGRRESVRVAMQHWQHLLLVQAFDGWWQQMQRAKVAHEAHQHFYLKILRMTFYSWRSWCLRRTSLAAALAELQGRCRLQVLSVVWEAWCRFVPASRVRKDLRDRVHLYRKQRLMAVGFLAWQQQAAQQALLRQKLEQVLVAWSSRITMAVFRCWREAVLLQQRKRGSIVQITDVQLYRQHVIQVVNIKVNNGLMLKAFNCWRDTVDANERLRQAFVAAHARWMHWELAKAFASWREHTYEGHIIRQAVRHHTQRLLVRSFDCWRELVLLQQQYRIIIGLVVNRMSQRLMLQAWTAWREVIDQRHQVARRLCLVRQRWVLSDLQSAWNSWREALLLKKMSQMAIMRWHGRVRASCFTTWRLRAAQRRSAGDKEWAKLAWLLPKLRAADSLRDLQLLRCAFNSWGHWVRLVARNQHVTSVIAARWASLHLSAAWHAWRERVAQQAAKKQAVDSVSRRWRNLHLAAAFQAWFDMLLVKRHHKMVLKAVADRWRNLHAAAAFGAWRTYVRQRVEYRAAHDLVARRWLNLHLAAAFSSWRGAALAAAQRASAAEAAAGRKMQACLQRAFASWKRTAVSAQAMRASAATVAGRRRQLSLQAVFAGWQEAVAWQRAKVQAELHWRQVRLRMLFGHWRQYAAVKAAHARDLARRISAGRLRACLYSWHCYSRKLSGAARLLRRLLVSTLSGAFHEWRDVALEAAHWHRVTDMLLTFINMDEAGTSSRTRAAGWRWLNWPLSVAFDTWRGHALEQAREHSNELKATSFLCFALALKGLEGFKMAVQAARSKQAANQHRSMTLKGSVVNAWGQAAQHLKVKRQKLMTGLLHYTQRLSRRGLAAWLTYSRYRRVRAQQRQLAHRHHVLQRTAACLRFWQQLASFWAPIHRALSVLRSKRRLNTLQHALAGWRLQCRRSHLVRQALARLTQRTLAAAFISWRGTAASKARQNHILQVAVSRLRHLLLSRALNRWAEAAQQLRVLRAKARKVLQYMLLRRLRAALNSWREAAAQLVVKRQRLATALWYWCKLLSVKAINTWIQYVQEARLHQALAHEMLSKRQKRQQQSLLHWWHLLAQDLHHQRVVLAWFRARHIRRDGAAVFMFWRHWARDRVRERIAIVARWNRLLVTAFGAWLQHHEDLRMQVAAVHDATRCNRHTLLAWKVALTVIERKRILTAQGAAMHRLWSLKKATAVWMRMTYYKHIGQVAVHFRVRRLGCVMLRHWLQAADMLAQERVVSLELTHHLAKSTALAVLAYWQSVNRAQRHHRRHVLLGCCSFWAYWAPHHRASNADWRAAAEELQQKKRARSFCTWRWYCQVRRLREIAFQTKQRALKEALVIGEQVARRRRAALLTACFMAWKVQVSKYRKVAEKLAGLLQHSLSTCFRAWTDQAQQARVRMLQAERHASTKLLHKLLPAWKAAAEQLQQARAEASTVALWLLRQHTVKKVLQGWREEMLVVAEQRSGLWRLMLVLLHRERNELLQAAVCTWRDYANKRIALRSCIAAFVNKRRLGCLSLQFTLWHQFSKAMRGAEGATAVAMWAASPTVGSLEATRRGRMHEYSYSADLSGRALDVDWVDVGSDDSDELFSNLPITLAAAAAAERRERQQPLLDLCKGHKHRRQTLNDSNQQYIDLTATGAGAGLLLSLPIVADSMLQVCPRGVANIVWALAKLQCAPDAELHSLLLNQFCRQLDEAVPQDISNVLWGVAKLTKEHAAAFSSTSTGVAAASSRLGVGSLGSLSSGAALAGSSPSSSGSPSLATPPLLKRLLEHLCCQQEHLELHHVSSVLRDVAQVLCLHLLWQRRQVDQQQQQPRNHVTEAAEQSKPAVPGSETTGQGAHSSDAVPAAGGRDEFSSRSLPKASSSCIADESAGTLRDVAGDAEEVLVRLAAAGGPQDASSTVAALAMLTPLLHQLGLQQGVATLCCLLPAAALPHQGLEGSQCPLAALARAPPATQRVAAAGASTTGSLLGQSAGLPASPPGSHGWINAVLQHQSPHQQLSSARPLLMQMHPIPDRDVSRSTSSVSNITEGSLGGSGGSGCLTPAVKGALAVFEGSGGSSAELLVQMQLPPPAADTGAAGQVCGGHSSTWADASIAGLALAGMQLEDIEPLGLVTIHKGPDVRRGPPGPDGTAEAPPALSPACAGVEGALQPQQQTAPPLTLVLSKVLGSAPSPDAQAAAAALLPPLGSKLLRVLPHATARGIANVLWGYSRLRNLQQAELLPSLIQAFLQQLPSAACRDSAVVLWSLARLVDGQDMASLGLTAPLLQRLGSAVVAQLAQAAETHGNLQHQPRPPATPSTGSSGAAADVSAMQQEADRAGPPSSRDISNSLMALARLGFQPVPADNSSNSNGRVGVGVAGGAAAAGGSQARAPAAAAGTDVAVAEPARQEEALLQPMDGADSGERACVVVQQLYKLSVQQQQQQQTLVDSSQPKSAPNSHSQHHGQQEGCGPGELLLLLQQIEVIVGYLLRHAAVAKTLDLQEAATALKQLGLTLGGLNSDATFGSLAGHGRRRRDRGWLARAGRAGPGRAAGRQDLPAVGSQKNFFLD
eukprot:gene9297-9462_t